MIYWYYNRYYDITYDGLYKGYEIGNNSNKWCSVLEPEQHGAIKVTDENILLQLL